MIKPEQTKNMLNVPLKYLQFLDLFCACILTCVSEKHSLLVTVVGLRLWLQWTYGKAGVGCLSALLRFTALSEALNTTAQCSRALFQIAQACLDVKMFTSVYVPARSHQRPPWARWQIWSLGPPRHILYAFENVSILLNLFLSPTWEWTLAERWLADKKQVETKKKSTFSILSRL